MSSSIRIMTLQDLDAVYDIELATNSFPWAKSTIEQSIASTKLSVLLEYDDVAVGYAVVSYVVGEAELLNICIHPEMQGKGLGGYLLEYIIEQATDSGNHDLYLEVRAGNKAAIHLYEKMGFNEVGCRANYYPAENGREDAILMALPLSL